MDDNVVPGMDDSMGSRLDFPTASGSYCLLDMDDISVTNARVNADFPTLAAPTMYTSLPSRCCLMSATTSSIPSFVLALTACIETTVSFLKSRESSNQSKKASWSLGSWLWTAACFGSRSILVPTAMIGLPPIKSRMELESMVPLKSSKSTRSTMSDRDRLTLDPSSSRSCCGVSSSSSSPRPTIFCAKSSTPGIIFPCDNS